MALFSDLFKAALNSNASKTILNNLNLPPSQSMKDYLSEGVGVKSDGLVGSAAAQVGALQSSVAALGGGTMRGLSKVAGDTSIGGVNFAGRTFALTQRLSRSFTRVRLHVFGLGAANGIAASAAVSVSAASPSQPAGGAAAFKSFVFPVNSFPASTIGSGSSSVPNIASSDWLDLPSVARTDGGAGFLLYLRTYEDATSAGNRSSMTNSGTTPPADVDTAGFWHGYQSGAANVTLSTGSFGANVNGPACFIEYETTVAGKTVTFIGDSTILGRDVYGMRTRGAGSLAVDTLVAEGFRLTRFNAGWSGSSTAGATGQPPADPISGYWAQFMAQMAVVSKLPDIAVFQPTSVNNGYNLWNNADCAYWCDKFISWAKINGVVPVLVTPVTIDGASAGQETNRRACVATIKAKALAASIPCIDQDAVLTNQASSTGAFIDPLDTPDGTHFTTQGGLKLVPAHRAGILASYR